MATRLPASVRKRGFTFSELLVALAVASLLVAVVYQVFISQQRVFTAQEDVAEAQQNARVAVDELTRTVSPLGAGAAVAQGQARILLAHPDQILFNADLSSDHDALAAGTDLTGVAGHSADDPYDAVPGSYAGGTAETYRYYLRPDGSGHHSLYREINLNPFGRREVAMHLGNLRVGQALFSYYGDFDGDGIFETLDRVDRATSPRVAAGAPLDAVIRRVDLRIVAESPFPDPRLAVNAGYRQTVLQTSITPRNLWDCPELQPMPTGLGVLRAPVLRGTTTPIRFRVTRGAVAEQGRSVLFSVTGPPGFVATSDHGTTGADGTVTAQILWPMPGPPCTTLPAGTYTVTATTAAPPTLDTPFGTCAPSSAAVELVVIDGLILTARFFDDPAQLATCGDTAPLDYELLDGCGRLVQPTDVDADQVWFVDPSLSGSFTPATATAGQPSGTVAYRSATGAFAAGTPRDGLAPNPFTATLEARLGGGSGPVIGRTAVEVYPLPDTLSGLTANLSGTGALFSDCPSSVGLNAETFAIADTCGNPVWTLNGSYLGHTYSVEARLDSVYPGNVGGLTSTHNAPLPLTPIAIRKHTGIAGAFDVSYSPPTCGLGQFSRDVELLLTPSWDPGSPAGPVTFQVAPCTSCSIAVLDPAGTATTLLNRECDPAYEVVVTHCESPGPAAVELVLLPLAGSPPSFDPAAPVHRLSLAFTRTTPPGTAQQAGARLYMGWADTGSRFRLAAYLPDQATYLGGMAPSAVLCESEPVTVDTSCEELLISDTPDNRNGFPANSRPEEVPICATEGTPVCFRVKDCDQNRRDFAADDLTGLSGSSQGILVEARDRVTRALLDQEAVDALYEVGTDGVGSANQPYFQGSLLITRDAADVSGSGRLRVPEGRVVELRATYRDPDDPGDGNCEAFALLVPPLPVCLPYPAASFGDWQGELTVRGGDAVVAGDLFLPAVPQLVGKDAFDPVDRFFNAYVGGLIYLGAAPASGAGPVGQPLALAPNYLQRVPDTASLLTRLDYTVLKTLAKARQVYWEPNPASGRLVNPYRTDPASGQPLTGTFQQVLHLPSPGARTVAHPQEFLFIDAPTRLQTAAALDRADLADLPRYSITGDFYTEGLIYVAGSVELCPVGGGQAVPVAFAADRDARYDEAAGGFTRADLPFDFDPTSTPISAGSVTVHWNGVLYAEGEIALAGGPVLHGVLSAERGVRSTDSAEIWYDPRWLSTRLDLCSECCGLSLSPASPTALLGAPLQLTANRPQGQVVWESLTPHLAQVDGVGAVEPLQAGNALIRATDAAGCVTEVEVAVTCGLTLVSSAGTSLSLGEATNLAASGTRGTLSWASDTPTTLALDRTSGISVLATALGLGGSRVTATDTVPTSAGTAQCEAILDLVVNCPRGRSLVASPLGPAPGGTVTLAVLDPTGSPATGTYALFADGAALPGPFLTFGSPGTATFTATLPGGTCPLGPVTATATCTSAKVTPALSTVSVGDTVHLSVEARTPDYSLSIISGPGALVGPTAVRVGGVGTVVVGATDPFGCTATAAVIEGR